jgi:hypothetical protein
MQQLLRGRRAPAAADAAASRRRRPGPAELAYRAGLVLDPGNAHLAAGLAQLELEDGDQRKNLR